MTQREEVLQYIQTHGSITRQSAANLHIYELSSRIGELEKAGYQFDRNKLSGNNKHGRRWNCIAYSNPRKVVNGQI